MIIQSSSRKSRLRSFSGHSTRCSQLEQTSSVMATIHSALHLSASNLIQTRLVQYFEYICLYVVLVDLS